MDEPREWSVPYALREAWNKEADKWHAARMQLAHEVERAIFDLTCHLSPKTNQPVKIPYCAKSALRRLTMALEKYKQEVER